MILVLDLYQTIGPFITAKLNETIQSYNIYSVMAYLHSTASCQLWISEPVSRG